MESGGGSDSARHSRRLTRKAGPSEEPPGKDGARIAGRKVSKVPKMERVRKKLLLRKLGSLRRSRRRQEALATEARFLSLSGDMLRLAEFRGAARPDPAVAARLHPIASTEETALAVLYPNRPKAPAPPPPPSPAESLARSLDAAKALQIQAVSSTSPLSAAETPKLPSGPVAGEGSVERAAKMEAVVMARVAELRRQGLWSASELPLCAVPPRNKTHWDYLLEEMRWMAQDFAQERRLKRAAAKKIVRDIARIKKDEEDRAARVEKEKERNLKKVASSIAKEIRAFWSNVEKVVDYKAQSILDATKRKAMDAHLDFIVGQTEKYSSMVKEGLTAATPSTSRTPSLKDDKEDYDSAESESDDERTIAKAEKTDGKENVADEISALEKESLMEVDDVLADLPPEYLDYLKGRASGKRPPTPTSEDGEDEEESEEASTSEDDVEEETPTPSSAPLSAEAQERQDELTTIAEAALEFQPKGFTLDTANVVTPVPFLLKHTLREYQHVGLDWLVALYKKNLNGILADEMGLGKTIQTIAVLAHLACEEGNWGPHLIVVPTSVMLNWEMELKKWCPAFKILTYYGSQKERKEKRRGWSRPNAFHVCVTSYKLVIQDHRAFRAKRWEYFVLDEAQNIKNFKSQRWQMLLHFNAHRRLLLTGTPLQNNLMELWSLMHFLMPHVFASHRDFKDWFANPLSGMVEGASDYNDTIVRRLHKVLRPFILRRLKAQVERQLPQKYEHVVPCALSRRQRFLYDDFMARGTTKHELTSGNVMSVLNVLMQLRKVCNHPNLFEPRPVQTPLAMPALRADVPASVRALLTLSAEDRREFCRLPDLLRLNRVETQATAEAAKRLALPSRRLVEQLDARAAKSTVSRPGLKLDPTFNFYAVRDGLEPPSSSSSGGERRPAFLIPAAVDRSLNHAQPITVQFPDVNKCITVSLAERKRPHATAGPSAAANVISLVPQPQGGALATATLGEVGRPEHRSPTKGPGTPTLSSSLSGSPGPPIIRRVTSVKIVGGNRVPVTTRVHPKPWHPIQGLSLQRPPVPPPAPPELRVTPQEPPPRAAHIITINPQGGRVILPRPASGATWISVRPSGPQASSGQTFQIRMPSASAVPGVSVSSAMPRGSGTEKGAGIPTAAAPPLKKPKLEPAPKEELKEEEPLSWREEMRRKDADYYASAKFKDPIVEARRAAWESRRVDLAVGRSRRDAVLAPFPVFGADLIRLAQGAARAPLANDGAFAALTRGLDVWLADVVERFLMMVPRAETERSSQLHTTSVGLPSFVKLEEQSAMQEMRTAFQGALSPIHVHHQVSTSLLFPETRLIQYDCGKLQELGSLLRVLFAGAHRCLIFTQMSKMLDILETFLSYFGYRYLRLDGSTKIQDRQIMMERFNADKRIFVFILSTRSGGIGVNLTGADTVIFYDSDWNPTMDAQAQDRCHRIGQTRDVHIYRLISERTVEENVLKKAQQKRRLGEIAIEDASFTAEFFRQSNIRDIFEMEDKDEKTSPADEEAPRADAADLEKVMGAVEEKEDAAAAAETTKEVRLYQAPPEDFGDAGAKADEAMEKVEADMARLMEQLRPVERYAVRMLEDLGQPELDEEIRATEESMAAAQSDWAAGHEAALAREAERVDAEEEEDFALTYFAPDLDLNQVNSRKPRPKRTPKASPPKSSRLRARLSRDEGPSEPAPKPKAPVKLSSRLPTGFPDRDHSAGSCSDSGGEGRRPGGLGAYERPKPLLPSLHSKRRSNSTAPQSEAK